MNISFSGFRVFILKATPLIAAILISLGFSSKRGSIGLGIRVIISLFKI
jgi:hypothetical protein